MTRQSITKTVLLHIVASEIVLLPALLVVLVVLYSMGLPAVEIVLFGAIGITLLAIALAVVRYRKTGKSR